ncbi:hypothetical protein [Pedobacter faecalis]|uniref:hypothetical protein n=1 Tax=Pedobacter faecalis TaxID=3041495 RepID=UPI0025505EE6|nr:hypothetical protein [Pedobacter sp. ELA7]
MTHTITLKEGDFITFQLYGASTNTEKIKTRKRNYLSLIALGIFFIIIGYYERDTFLFYYATCCVIVVALFYYKYLKWRLKKHYTKFVKDTYKGAFNESVQLEIEDELLRFEDKTGESCIKISEIIGVTEIASHFFIKISTGPSLILTKGSPSLNQEIAS